MTITRVIVVVTIRVDVMVTSSVSSYLQDILSLPVRPGPAGVLYASLHHPIHLTTMLERVSHRDVAFVC